MIGYILFVLILLFLISSIFALSNELPREDKWKIRFAKDKWNSKSGTIIKYDKIEHFLCCFVLYFGFVLLKVDFLYSLYFVFLIGIIWEVKDAFLPWEKFGWYGGDGFSMKDLIADMSGVFLGTILVNLIMM